VTIDNDEIMLIMDYNDSGIHDINVDDIVEITNDNITSLIIEQAILQIDDLNNDFYTTNAMHASQENGYFTSHNRNEISDNKDIFYSFLPLNDVQAALKSLSASIDAFNANFSISSASMGLRAPFIYLTDSNQQDIAINEVISNFNLNTKQTLAFHIIAEHTLGRNKVGNQLLMGLFGEAGTGKSRVIDAIRAWFQMISRDHELMIIATTGTAIFNIKSITLHSALDIAVEKDDKPVKMSHEKRDQWKTSQYLIIDEVSMMGSSLIMKLNDKLCLAKSSKADEIFGGINLLFIGDFLQLPFLGHFLALQHPQRS